MGVEGEGESPFSIRRAEAHLLHVRMPRAVQRVYPWPSQQRSELFQQVSDGIDFVLDLSVQIAKLRHELVMEVDPTSSSTTQHVVAGI